MKVTVYFGNIRVIVPCGKGDILVRDLVDLAITRYKKATGKPPSSIVTIHNLKSSRDDGILYPDDQLNDVADDREQIIADFEENYSPIPHYNCGDGTSTSSACTGSPDLFSVEVSSHSSVPYAHSDVEITEDPLPSGITPLQVRRGSEPALNALFPTSPTSDPSKRWSTAVVMNTNCNEKQESLSDDGKTMPTESLVVNGDSKRSSLNFSRGSGRLSILGSNPETYRWVEAADRQLIKDFNENFTTKTSITNCSIERDPGSDTSSTSDERERTIILKNESGPLGIHVVPDYDSKGRDTGLVIQGIEAGGRIDRDGRFHVGDRITEINGKSLRNVSFQTAQEIFKNALQTPQIKLELVRGGMSHSKTAAIPRKPPPPVYPKPIIPDDHRKVDEESDLVEGEERGGISTKVATVTPTKKIPSSATHRLATTNTRRIGKKLSIQLTKGTSGLGFSITTRDNPAGGNSPIYIKNVLPKGAAIEDGQLQPGDRLLEVNSIEMTGKSQAEAVSILRNTSLGGVVNLVVSRQEVDVNANHEQETDSQISVKLEDEAGIFPWKHREILTFQIPLSDTGSAGLGVSVKGKSTSSTAGPVDLGIFIKSIISGGAASKDGRLQTNDQLVNINGISLLGISNSNAMETLRKAMTQMDGPIPNVIILTIARRILSPSEDELDNSSIHQRTDSMNSQVNSLNSLDRSREKTEYLKGTYQNSLNSNNSSEQAVSNTSDLIKEAFKDTKNCQKSDSNLPGCNPVIERLTGQISSGRFKRLPNENSIYSNHDHMQQKLIPSGDEKNKSPYSPTVNITPRETVMIEDEYNPSSTNVKSSTAAESIHLQPPDRLNHSDVSNVAPASSQLSLEEINAGFARDGFGRQSMSEKRHAQLDARHTDTYQRNKKAREERDRHRQLFEQEYMLEKEQVESSQGVALTSNVVNSRHSIDRDEPLGPSLGLRKSSSLESLQTMIQELNKDDEALKNAMQSANSRGSRSRGCNESFRAAVDRSYEAPPPSTMETLDEESESGSSVGHILGRAAEIGESRPPGLNTDAFHDDVLNMYCRNSKSKKKSLLKGLGSVFKFGKNRKSVHDLKGKFGEEITSDQENYATISAQQTVNKEQERIPEHPTKANDIHKKQLPQVPRDATPAELVPNRQERMQNLREQHQRLHQKRQGHYPLEQKEEYYEKEIKEKEGKLMSSADVAHTRSHSIDICEDAGQRILSRPGFNEPNRYSHYMNYKEIQQHINQYHHHDQMPVSKLPSKLDSSHIAPSKSHRQDRPSSNYFEYESIQQLHRHMTNQALEQDTNSLPRGSHITKDALLHPQVQTNQHFYNHDSNSGYERMNMHHYYPNSALYSHIVPGSKV